MVNTINEFKQKLKDKGYKLTVQRKAVLDVMLENDGQHLSTEEVYKYVKDKCPEIGLATVYRTLLLFDSLNLISKMNFDDGFGRYEINKNADDHGHHHLICVKCGRVEEVEGDLLEALEENILQKNKFMVTDHTVKFYGICEKCRN